MSESGQTDPSGQVPRTGPTDLPTKAHHQKAFKFQKEVLERKWWLIKVFN